MVQMANNMQNDLAQSPTMEATKQIDSMQELADAIAVTFATEKKSTEEMQEVVELIQQPDTSNLDAAVKQLPDGTLLFLPKVGEFVTIERFATCLSGNPWLDTETYEVKSIDHDTGMLHLHNHSLRQGAMSNFIVGTQKGYRFLLPDKNKKDRRRAVVLRSDEADSKPVEFKGASLKRKGRPPGVKNRSKEEIKVEKQAREAMKEKKRTKRGIKR